MKFILHGFQEVVFSIRNLQRATEMYCKLGGWNVIDKGLISKDYLSFWSLPNETIAHYALLAYPGRTSGYVRLIAFSNVEQKHIRNSAQSWDTGGIYDVDVRVKDVQSKLVDFQNEGWTGFSDIEEYHFEHFHVSEILLKGYEDIVFALIQRHAPKLEGFPKLEQMSHVFNSSQIVKDIEQSKSFYLDQLGFKIYMESNSENGAPGPNIFGIPYNVYPTVQRKIVIVSPDGSNKGSVELVELEGLTGNDFSKDAVPPNLGILMLRFPVQNIDHFIKDIELKKVDIWKVQDDLELGPYKNSKVVVLQSPDGAWLEFYEERD